MGHNSKKTVITLCCFIVMIVLGMVAGAVFVFRKYKWQNVRMPSEDARYISSEMDIIVNLKLKEQIPQIIQTQEA